MRTATRRTETRIWAPIFNNLVRIVQHWARAIRVPFKPTSRSS